MKGVPICLAGSLTVARQRNWGFRTQFDLDLGAKRKTADVLIEKGNVVGTTGEAAFEAHLRIAAGRIDVPAIDTRKNAKRTIEVRDQVWPLTFSILTPTQALLCGPYRGPKARSGRA